MNISTTFMVKGNQQIPNTQAYMLEWADTDLKIVTIINSLELRVRTLAINRKPENFRSVSYLKSENSKTKKYNNQNKSHLMDSMGVCKL